MSLEQISIVKEIPLNGLEWDYYMYIYKNMRKLREYRGVRLTPLTEKADTSYTVEPYSLAFDGKGEFTSFRYESSDVVKLSPKQINELLNNVAISTVLRQFAEGIIPDSHRVISSKGIYFKENDDLISVHESGSKKSKKTIAA